MLTIVEKNHLLRFCECLANGRFSKKGLNGILPRPGNPGSPSGNAYNYLEATIRAISDIHILLALALAMTAMVFGICKTLQYHFRIGINLLLLACANYLQTLGLTRQYWHSWPAGTAALLRLLVVVGIYFFCGWILGIQNQRNLLSNHQFTVERVPEGNKRDSAILLKAACFLDPIFQNATFASLTNAERTQIGIQENHGLAFEWILELMLAACTFLVLMFRLLCSIFRSLEKRMKKTRIYTLFCGFIWVLSMIVFCYSAATVSNLRSWVAKSGWLEFDYKSNPDNNVSGFGQTVALLSVVAMLITALENAFIIVKRVSGKKNASKQKSKNGKRVVRSKKRKRILP